MRLDRRSFCRSGLAMVALAPLVSACGQATPAGAEPSVAQGLIAVDKVGGAVLFLDPATYAEVARLDDFPPRPHELTLAPDRRTAYVPIYGAGIYGKNPDPGHLIAVIDLAGKRHAGDIDVSPYRAPHTMEFGPDGLLYVACDASGVVAIVDVAARQVVGAIDTGSKGSHRLALLPDGSKIYVENEDDQPFASVLDVKARRMVGRISMPNGAQGIAASSDGRTVLIVDGKTPELAVVDTTTDRVVRRVALNGHEKAAQIVRYSPDGQTVIATSYEAPLATILDGARLQDQTTLRLGRGPMNMAFHPDGRTVLVANHDEGTISVVDLKERKETRRFPAGRGVEALAFY